MKRIALLALASGLAIAAATPANAAITISYSVNGGALTTLATDSVLTGSAGFQGNDGGYFFNVGATGRPLTASPYDFLTQSLNINSNGVAGTLNVFITETGLPRITNGTLLSTFTSNTMLNSTTRITSSYTFPTSIADSNTLQTNNFTNPGVFQGLNTISTPIGTFSLTTRYDITFGAGTGNFNGTANITTAVPEPATWGMMIMGFGLMGGVLRRRKTSVAFA